MDKLATLCITSSCIATGICIASACLPGTSPAMVICSAALAGLAVAGAIVNIVLLVEYTRGR